MSDSVNPYESPHTESAPTPTISTGAALNDTMLRFLKESSPWLRFLGILAFIQAGFMVMGGISMIGMGALAAAMWESIPGMDELGSFFDSMGGAFGAIMGVLYIGGAALCFFPGYYMYTFGAKIRSYLQNGQEKELELAFSNNKSLWKFFGILAIVCLAFVPVMIVIMIIAVVASVASGGF